MNALRRALFPLMLLLSGLSGPAVADEPGAPGAPASYPPYDTCTQILSHSMPLVGECGQITLHNGCTGDRYLVVCRRTGEGQSCQITAEKVKAGQDSTLDMCLPANYMLRHAACETPDGCDAFAKGLGAATPSTLPLTATSASGQPLSPYIQPLPAMVQDQPDPPKPAAGKTAHKHAPQPKPAVADAPATADALSPEVMP